MARIVINARTFLLMMKMTIRNLIEQDDSTRFQLPEEDYRLYYKFIRDLLRSKTKMRNLSIFRKILELIGDDEKSRCEIQLGLLFTHHEWVKFSTLHDYLEKMTKKGLLNKRRINFNGNAGSMMVVWSKKYDGKI